jgi:hypothetical protein
MAETQEIYLNDVAAVRGSPIGFLLISAHCRQTDNAAYTGTAPLQQSGLRRLTVTTITRLTIVTVVTTLNTLTAVTQ